MRPRRLPTSFLVPPLLIGLVALLATLQYRWLGQVSEAEREQLQRTLGQRARDFSDEFDREISQVYTALRMTGDVRAPSAWAAWSDAYERWRRMARFPGLVSAVYLAEASGDHVELEAYDRDGRSFGGPPLAAWPAAVEGLRVQLEQSLLPPTPPAMATINGMRFVTLALPPVAIDGSVLVVPVFDPAHENGAAKAEAVAPPSKVFETLRAFIVVQLDRSYIRHSVLPALVAKHFPEDASEAYRVAILQATGEPLFSRGFPAGTVIDAAKVDVAVPLFAIRVDVAHNRVNVAGDLLPTADTLFRTAAAPDLPGGSLPPGGKSQLSVVVERRGLLDAAGRGSQGAIGSVVRIAGPGWRIVLQHVSGSLDVAVAKARRRNLALSFSILGILVAGVVLVVGNARRAQRLAAKQVDFVATVTHELRTPLAVIRSAAQNLSAGVVAEPTQARRYGELIDAEGQRLAETVEQVLAYAGLESGRAPLVSGAVDVAHAVSQVIESSRTMCDEAGVAIEFDAPEVGAVPMIAGDEVGIRLAVRNLVSNAVKHGAAGRWVGVSVTTATHGRRPEVRVSVRDRGRGMDAADLPRIFDPFYRGRRALDAQVRGNGLGLSLVKRIVEAHGGHVSVTSKPEAGTEFVICLPIRDASEGEAAPAGARA